MSSSISTRNMTHGEWLQHRRRGIGGSDAATIVGLNPYSTLYSLWADKTGRLPDKPDTEAMRQGRDLEEYVAQRFCEETGKKVRRRNQIIRNSTFPFALANIDRDIVGERAGLECKTTSVLNLKKFKNGDFPANYYVQCMHYLAVTGYERWYLAVLIFGTEFKVFTIERDEDEITALMDAEKAFWNTHVIPDVPPLLDGLQPTSNAIDAMFPAEFASDMSVILNCSEQLRSYIELKQQIKTLQGFVETVEQTLKTNLGDATEGNCSGFKVTWKPQMRKTFDCKRFAAEHPEVDISKYYKTSSYRVLKIKEAK